MEVKTPTETSESRAWICRFFPDEGCLYSVFIRRLHLRKSTFLQMLFSLGSLVGLLLKSWSFDLIERTQRVHDDGSSDKPQPSVTSFGLARSASCRLDSSEALNPVTLIVRPSWGSLRRWRAASVVHAHPRHQRSDFSALSLIIFGFLVLWSLNLRAKGLVGGFEEQRNRFWELADSILLRRIKRGATVDFGVHWVSKIRLFVHFKLFLVVTGILSDRKSRKRSQRLLI